MNFILNNSMFEIIILILMMINFLGTFWQETKATKKHVEEIKKLSDIQQFKTISIIIVVVIMLFCVFKFFGKEITSLLFLLFIVIALISTLKSIKNKESKVSIDNKYDYTFSSLIFIIFFSSFAVPIYTESFIGTNHITKEILLIIFILIKLVSFVFFALINILVMTSNILRDHTKSEIYINDFSKKIKKEYEFIFYDYELNKKYNTNFWLNIDKIIFFISVPLYLIINLFNIFIIKIKNWIFKYGIIIIKKSLNFYQNKHKSILNITKVSTVISLLILNTIIIFEDGIFSIKIKETFNLISTVILIPIIYDSIKDKKNS